ncbi:MAG: hypothetical protein H6878_10830 [Rhodobiaceae bacterium]|nr:hypothetical protein [Rhodobiaceae bacterium]MCC0016751.1 hypothetical protein [Rhodobiaceae bacterium]MCC0042176.1 hypothetical protein [Rhodobiaceae bacterium]
MTSDTNAMEHEGYLRTIAANRRARIARVTRHRLKRKFHIRVRKARSDGATVAAKAFAVMVGVCATYALVYLVTMQADPTPNIVTAPSGIATFFRPY